MAASNALDVQAEDVTKGLKEKTQQLKENAKEKGYEMMKNVEGFIDKEFDPTSEFDPPREQSDRQRESKEKLANPKPIDRHPKGPIEEIKQSAHDVADAQNKND
ncbi:28239_t:CDS:2 [Racocetra persica]|uniref:28239_t:CDS:1 n=1 Tax=Racocetra persica TaxID=160502 RepID=A0ACA9PXK4_9GLOM|nr:28239_t:CDS:2 [Racocetra persica]